MSMRKLLIVLALAAGSAASLAAQDTRGVGAAITFQGYSFPKEIGVTSATLLIMPVTYAMPVSRTFSFDVYTAYARGAVNTGEQTQSLSGMVDTRVRANIALSPWAVFTAGVNLPTGKAKHDAEEAVVTAALSTELLGFREALWGTGFGATAGLATAWRAGSTGIGFGASYRLAGEFEPSTEEAIKYAPGDETRVRVAIDQNIGDNKLTLGATFQKYADDKLNGRNLFAPGNRWRGDVAYSFRSGPSSAWTFFLADVWRANGDVSLQIVDSNNRPVGDTSFVAGQQNLAVVGFAGGTRLGNLALRPAADFRILTRKSGESEGWLFGAGTEMPMRRGSMDWIPSVRLLRGAMEDATDARHSFWGGELALTVRWGGQQ